MSEEIFSYQAFPDTTQTPVDRNLTMPAPIWPEFNNESATSQKMIRAKRINGENFWSDMRQVFAHDFKTLPLERYKVWASSLTVPIMSRNKPSEYIKMALADAHNEHVNNALNEPLVGMTINDFNSFYRVFDDSLMTMNRIFHYGHLKYMVAGMRSRIHGKGGVKASGDVVEYLKSLKRIVEIGAGAGEMADVCRQLGFEGEYVIYDFKEMTDIQQWFHEKRGHKNNKYVNDVNDLEPADLCIATWSLTEMPIADRDAVMQKLSGTKDWLITYTDQIFGMENEKWIMEDFAMRFHPESLEKRVFWQDESNYVFVRHTS